MEDIVYTTLTKNGKYFSFISLGTILCFEPNTLFDWTYFHKSYSPDMILFSFSTKEGFWRII